MPNLAARGLFASQACHHVETPGPRSPASPSAAEAMLMMWRAAVFLAGATLDINGGVYSCRFSAAGFDTAWPIATASDFPRDDIAFFNAALGLGQAVGVLETKLQSQVRALDARLPERKLRNHAILIFHFDRQLAGREDGLRQIENLSELAGGQPVGVVPGRTDVGLQHARLAGAKGAATIDEFLGDVPHLGDVEVRRHEPAVRQGQSQVEFRPGLKTDFELFQVHVDLTEILMVQVFIADSPASLNCAPTLRTATASNSLSSGKAQKRSTRRAICEATFTKNWYFSSSVPSKAAGSGEPQWAIIGCPGHTGQASFALSQTVMTKSNFTSLNSSQDFDRAALASRLYFSRRVHPASGLTRPVGLAPALNTSKRPFPLARSRYSPRMLRAELPVHKIRTLNGGWRLIRNLSGSRTDWFRQTLAPVSSAGRGRAGTPGSPRRSPAGRPGWLSVPAEALPAARRSSSCPRARPRPVRARAGRRGAWRFSPGARRGFPESGTRRAAPAPAHSAGATGCHRRGIRRSSPNPSRFYILA